MNFCPSCGSPQDAGVNFCVGCGFKLDSINVPSPPSEALGGANSVPSSPIVDANYRLADCMGRKGYEIRSDLFNSRAKTVETLARVVKSLVGIKEDHEQPEVVLKGGTYGVDLAYEVVRLATGENAVSLDEAAMQGAKIAAELVAEIEPAAWAPVIAELATQAYNQAPFLYALFDCVARAGVNVPDVTQPPMRQQLPVQLPPPPAAWQPMVIPMSYPAPAPKNAGMSNGSKAALAVGAVMIGLVGALVLIQANNANNANNANTTNDIINNNVPVPVVAVTVSQLGAISCKSVLHGGFAFEGNCYSTATLTIAGDLPSNGVWVFMIMPAGQMHGSATVPAGFRGTVTVPITVQYGSPGCTPDSAYHTTILVYDAASFNAQTGASSRPPLASDPYTLTWKCS